MEKKDLFGICPYLTSQRVLSGKWSMYIIYLLSFGPIRFNELQRNMPKVEYYLSEVGEKFQPVLDALGSWGNEYIEFMRDRKEV